ncbi:MAG: hypothetical protein EBX50_23135 [Chitinophagia bacterium]|nr:hypothetical protein [Chitinophagia bacterium]
MTPLAKRFVLVSNGPGEVSNWVWPVVMRMRACHPEAWIEVALVPCQYASGQELVKIYNSVDEINELAIIKLLKAALINDNK